MVRAHKEHPASTCTYMRMGLTQRPRPTRTHAQVTHKRCAGAIPPGLHEELVVEFCPTQWRYYYDCIRVHAQVCASGTSCMPCQVMLRATGSECVIKFGEVWEGMVYGPAGIAYAGSSACTSTCLLKSHAHQACKQRARG